MKNILEQKGFIIKRSDKADGRVIHLDLTDKGEQFVKNEFPSEQVKLALDGMDSKDNKLLTNLLTKFLIQLQQKMVMVSPIEAKYRRNPHCCQFLVRPGVFPKR